MNRLISLILIACSFASNALSEEIRPGVFRTSDERFENLKDYSFAPHYLAVDSDPITSGGEKVFQTRVPGAKDQPHTIIKRAGHFLQEDASEQLATLINGLIAANPTSATKRQTHE